MDDAAKPFLRNAQGHADSVIDPKVRRQLEQAMDGQSGVSERVKEILYERGDTLERMGKPADAKVEFGRIYEFDIGFRDVGERLRKLEGGESQSTLSLEN